MCGAVFAQRQLATLSAPGAWKSHDAFQRSAAKVASFEEGIAGAPQETPATFC